MPHKLRRDGRASPPAGAPRLRVSVYFAVFVACLIATDTTGIVLCGLFAALIHELGHVAALYWAGAPPATISLRLFGAEMRLRGDARLRYGQEVAVALAGAAANVLLAALALLCAACGLLQQQALMLTAASLVLGAFNLLPIVPLDGGRALEAALCMRLPPELAHRAALIVAGVLLVPLAAAGFLLLFTTRFNVSLLLIAAYLCAALVLGDARRLFGRAGVEGPHQSAPRRAAHKRRTERET